MRTAVVLCLLASGPLNLTAQHVSAVTLNLGVATAYGGSGPSGSVRLELPLHQLSETVALVWGGSGWVAQIAMPASPYDVRRSTKGIGPLLAVQWRPGDSGWRLTAGGGMEYLWNRNEDRTIVVCDPPQDCGVSVPEHSRLFARDAGPGAVLAARLTLPPQAGATIEFGASGTRHALFDERAWWRRFEVGFRFEFGGGER